jgi:hypothetical protein
MNVVLTWDDFHLKFFLENIIFVKEYEDRFEFCAYEGPIIVKSTKMKSDNEEENIIFIDRYLTDKQNLIKVLSFEDIEDSEKIEEDDEEEEFETKIEEEIEDELGE